jgi:aspartyl-tRNA(Asn)/glutamyl-tRNA(Gln) amidotransferase subunit B
MSSVDQYEAIIGLEVHAQLLTNSKVFSSDSTEYGAQPNSNVSPITLGHPGTLPRLNKGVVEKALRMGLACNASITRRNEFARKNYFYADLPKGYQITQHKTPLCTGGYLEIDAGDTTKKVGLTRIHMEEDAGKSLHDQDPYYTLIDLNRAGVPLIEIVSEPDIRSGDEAYQYVTEIRRLVRYLDICDGNMEEGSLRCDANISVRPKNGDQFGDKVEVKNMNSIRNVKRAIEHEIERQVEVIEDGGTVDQETRNFDALSATTQAMRTKEMAHDYRYFPEPDLPPLIVHDEWLASVREQMPALPRELFSKYVNELGLKEYDAGVITDNKEIALYFEEIIKHTDHYKAAANWMMGPVKSYLNDNAVHIDEFAIGPDQIAAIIKLIDEGKINFSIAQQQLFPALLERQNGQEPEKLAEELNLIQESDESFINDLVEQAIQKYPDKVEEYKNGKTGLLGFFMGEVMKQSQGKVEPQTANELLRQKLEKQE